ncbi:MAG TPA: Rne/Rng family ribonuclease [Phycisphaerae bacterium]|nr:Rne/Rng family ribonuclease [Phycisphaerae bacterium]
MPKEMLINTLEGHECRIAIVDDGRLQELYVERSRSASHVGNIYKGRITNVEAAIQAAFVDFGLGKNGFLHISDLHPRFFPKGKATDSESVGRKRPHYHRPPIQECFKRGQEVVVQMTKEGIGTKGPTLTTYLSIPGRLLVMMPGMSRLGVSRKVEDDDLRSKAKATLEELKLPPNMGFIVRTAGIGRPKREMQRDLNYLLRLWKDVDKLAKEVKAPAEIYQESDLVIRTLRDIYNSEIKRIICDSTEDARKVKRFLDMAVPRGKHVVEVYAGTAGLFSDYGLENEIERMYARRVDLVSGGSLVIDQAEALVAIDINSGKFREHSDAETTALKTDLEAAREIARQLRIRDLGGQIVIDFIDLRDERHCRQVERELREAIKPDRAKTKILRMSQFGIVEMTRQRVRPSLKESIYRTCAHCDGAGVVKSEESQTIHIMRSLQHLCANDSIASVDVAVTPAVAHHLNNLHRTQLAELESATGRTIIVRAEPDLTGNEVRFNCLNQRGSSVAWEKTFAQPKTGSSGKVAIETVALAKLPKEKEPAAESTDEETVEKVPAKTRKKRSRRSRSRSSKTEAKVDAAAEAAEPAAETSDDEDGPKAKKSRRRGRRGGKKHARKPAKVDSDKTDAPVDTPEETALPEPPDEPAPTPADERPLDGSGAAEELNTDWPFADWAKENGEQANS